MAHRETDSTTAGDVLRILIDNGLDGMARALEALINEAMKLERAEFLGAAPHERTEDRRGYANGFKPRRLLRTVNSLENLNKQIRRRTSVAGLFPNERSLLRLVSAVLAETSEEWETGRVYLAMETE